MLGFGGRYGGLRRRFGPLSNMAARLYGGHSRPQPSHHRHTQVDARLGDRESADYPLYESLRQVDGLSRSHSGLGNEHLFDTQNILKPI